MKLFFSTLLVAAALAGPAMAGILDGKPADPEKRARPGGYYSQVANLKSLASSDCSWFTIKDGGGNVIDRFCR